MDNTIEELSTVTTSTLTIIKEIELLGSEYKSPNNSNEIYPANILKYSKLLMTLSVLKTTLANLDDKFIPRAFKLYEDTNSTHFSDDSTDFSDNHPHISFAFESPKLCPPFDALCSKIQSCYNKLVMLKNNFSIDTSLFEEIDGIVNEISSISSTIPFYILQSISSKTISIKKEHDMLLSANNSLSTLQNKVNNLQKELEKDKNDTIEYLQQNKLCKSFNDRADTLSSYSRNWLRVILVLIAVSVYFSYKHFSYMPEFSEINSDNIDYLLKSYLLYFPVALLDFWLFWIAAKKYLYYSRLADEYNYKNDISKAYFGYKDEILPDGREELEKLYSNTGEFKEIEAVRLKFLDNVLAIITKNPVESGMKTDTSPYTEIISKLLDQVKKQK